MRAETGIKNRRPAHARLPLRRRQQRSAHGGGSRWPDWYTEYNVRQPALGVGPTGSVRRSRYAHRGGAGGTRPATRAGAARQEPPCSIRCTRIPRWREIFQSTGIQNFLDFSPRCGRSPLTWTPLDLRQAAEDAGEGTRQGPAVHAGPIRRRTSVPWDFRFRPDLAPDWCDLGNRTDARRRSARRAASERGRRSGLRRVVEARSSPKSRPTRAPRRSPRQPRSRSLIDPSQNDSMIVAPHRGLRPRLLSTYSRDQHDQLHAARPVVGGGRRRRAGIF